MAKRPRRLPSLNALRAFWAAARHRSFAAAADELHVTASAVSLQIRQLEEELDFKLFERTPKGPRSRASPRERPCTAAFAVV